MNRLFIAAVLVAGSTAASLAQPVADPDPARFDHDIAAFEAEDAVAPPSPGRTLFVGSSSIRYWDVDREFPALRPIRRGYGGSHVTDTIHFAPRLIFRYQPALIVFYAGDADVGANKSGRQIARDTKKLVALIHARLPGTKVVVIGTKPSPLHWPHMPAIRTANAILKQDLAGQPLTAYADAEAALLGPDGQPRAEFYTENRLNLNERGYAAWTAALRPTIERMAATTP
jgi:GDSL-like Lipase/Acylhydrolase family